MPRSLLCSAAGWPGRPGAKAPLSTGGVPAGHRRDRQLHLVSDARSTERGAQPRHNAGHGGSSPPCPGGRARGAALTHGQPHPVAPERGWDSGQRCHSALRSPSLETTSGVGIVRLPSRALRLPAAQGCSPARMPPPRCPVPPLSTDPLLWPRSTWHRKHKHRFIFIGTGPRLGDCFSLGNAPIPGWRLPKGMRREDIPRRGLHCRQHLSLRLSAPSVGGSIPLTLAWGGTTSS